MLDITHLSSRRQTLKVKAKKSSKQTELKPGDKTDLTKTYCFADKTVRYKGHMINWYEDNNSIYMH